MGQLTSAGLRDLNPDTLADLAALNGALQAEFAERPLLPEEARVLMNGRLLASEDGSLRGGVAFQRHGELLVAMRGKFADESVCGNTAVVDTSKGWSRPRFMWLTGLDPEDRASDEVILGAVRALWGCPPGALARIDLERQLLTTGTTVSALGHEGVDFTKIGEIRLSGPHEDVVPPWVDDISEVMEEAIEEAKREHERIAAREALDQALAESSDRTPTLCIEDCIPTTTVVTVDQVGRDCEVRVDGSLSARFPPQAYAGNTCNLSPDHRWLTISPGAYLTAITHGLAADRPAGLRLGVFVPDPARSGVTNVLTGIAEEGLTIHEYRLITGFLSHARAEQWPYAQLKTTRFAKHAAGGLALVAKAPESEADFNWYVHNKGRTHVFEQTGTELTVKQTSALLPLLIEEPQHADAEEDGNTLWLSFERQLRMYTWDGDDASWTLLLEMDRPVGPDRDSYEAAARKDAGPRLDQQMAPYFATVFAHARGNSHWGYALWSPAAATATLSIQRASHQDDDGWARPRRGTITRVGEELRIEGGNEVDWFDIRLLQGPGGVLLARDREEGVDWDQVLCLFTPSGELADCDDDSGSHVAGSDGRAALITLPSSDEEQRFVGAVRNYEAGKITHPVRIMLLDRSQSPENQGPGTCRSGTTENQCLALRRDQVLRDLGDLEHYDVPGIGLARNQIAFLRSLARAIKEEPESPASYSVFAAESTLHAARFAADGSGLRLMSMAVGEALSPVAAFEADQRTSFLPPEHAWPRLLDIFGRSTQGRAPLQGSNLELPPHLGSEAWSTVLPADVEDSTRTVFFKAGNGSREVRIAGVADSPDVMAAAVSYLLQHEVDKIEVRRNNPIVAIAYPEPCLAHDPICRQSLVRLAPVTGQRLESAAFDRRKAPNHALEAAVDLFVVESEAGSVERNGDRPFEGLWREPPGSSLFRFSRSRPFRVFAEEGWAGCLSPEGVHWFDLNMEDVLDAWPETSEGLPAGEVEPCTKESPRHWTLTAGPRSAADTAGRPERRTILLHSRDATGKLRLLAVPRQDSTPPTSFTTSHPVDSAVAEEVVRELPKRIGPRDAILAMTDVMPSAPGTGSPMLVFEIADASNVAATGDSRTTRLVAFYRPRGGVGEVGVCTLSGIEIVRPEITGAEFSETHRLVVSTLHDGLSEGQQAACEAVRPREFLLIESEAGEWRIWERMNGGRPVEASRRARLQPFTATRHQVVRVAQANTHMTDAVSPESSNPSATDYVELRQFPTDEQSLRVWIDALLYDPTREAATTLERKIIRAVMRVSKRIGHGRPTVPDFRLNCLDDGCRLVEGAWGLETVLGIDLGSRGEPGPARAVLLLGPTWRKAGSGLASRLAARSTGDEHVQIFDLRSSPASDVHLAARGREVGAVARPVFHWQPDATVWRELGDLVPLPSSENADTKPSEVAPEQAILDRLVATPRPFRLIALPNGGPAGRGVVLLSLENHLLDGLSRTESFFQDGSTGPDILTDRPLDVPVDRELLARAHAVLSSGSFPRTHPVWLPGEGAVGLAISGLKSGFASGEIKPVSVQGIEPNAELASPKLAFGKNCRLPRDVARNLLAGYRHLGTTAMITCTIADGGVLLVDLAKPARQLAGTAKFRGKLTGEETLPETAALKLTQAAHLATGHPYPELSTGIRSNKHYAAHATSDGGRVWRERNGKVRELGSYSGIDVSDDGHLALLNELEFLPPDRPFTGTVQERTDYLALIVRGWNEIVVHRRADIATIRVELIGSTMIGEKPVDRTIEKLLDENVPRSFLASGERAAVAFARTETDLLGDAFAEFDGAINRFKKWPTDLASRRAVGVAQFLLEVLQEGRKTLHVHRRGELLIACRSGAREPGKQSEFVLFNLNQGDRAGAIEWDDHRCEDSEQTDDRLLDPIYALAAYRSAGDLGNRLLGYTTRNHTIGALHGDASAQARRLYTIETDRVTERCEAALHWDHPVRDGLTDWLARNGPCRLLVQSDRRIVADAEMSAVLLERDRSWSLEPFQDVGRGSLDEHAELLLDWFDRDTSLHTADCSAIRFGTVEALPGSPPIFSASVPCFGLALTLGGALETVFRRTDRPDQEHLSRDAIAWLARRFDGAISATAGYLLDVSDVLELTPSSRGTNNAVLFAWNISGQSECSTVLPINGRIGDRITIVRDLLRGQGPESNWQGESYVRTAWSELGTHEMVVLSRSKTDDCVKDFLTLPKHASLNNLQYKHFAHTSGRPNDGWTVVELGREPAKMLSLLEDGEEAAFFSLFLQTGGNVHGRSISIRSENDIRYAISRDQTLYHRLFPDSPACRKLPSNNVDALLARRERRNGRASSSDAWGKLFEAVGADEYMPRWYEPVLSGDPLHELDRGSGPC